MNLKVAFAGVIENNAIDKMRDTMIRQAEENSKDTIYDFHKFSGGRGYPDLHANMRTIAQDLKIKLGVLNQEESIFEKIFKSKEFYIVHASDRNLINETKKSLTLLSRARLDKTDILFNNRNSTNLDIENLGNHYYVYFSLEVGKELKKSKSKFGNHLYRIRYSGNKSSFIHSSMVLFDHLVPSMHLYKINGNKRLLDDIDISQESKEQLTRRKMQRGNSSFSGFENCINGLLYSILIDIRNLDNEDDRKKLLSTHSDDGINLIINGLYRPEVRVPIVAGFLEGEYEYIHPCL
ncbi:hypothetical protein FE392_01750 [Xenorhabdus sp. 12]|uniref:Uncharacterized protein n=1 Tax=Xenorhabdus santafensis TaxID=2582833 RepID=A0ABU4S7H7_9GAMM|nr:hypothetical protein [Xenorhabdus sp. 12]MDX7986061.1 hypothetical protein [Xenorhabdus sp. 12]